MSNIEEVHVAPHKFAGIDELRGYAAIAVLLFHASLRIGQPFLSGGYLAVDLFFLISGFVIAHAYDKKILDLGFFAFLRLRLIRFYPLYLLGTSFGIGLALLWMGFGRKVDFGPGDLAITTIYAFLLIPMPINKFDGSLFPLDIPAWSLSIEIIINAGYAAFFAYLSRIFIVSFSLVSGLALLSFYIYPNIIAAENDWRAFYVGLARVGFSFPLGILMYRARHLLPDLGKLGVAVVPILVACLWGAQSTARDLLFIMIVSPALLLIAAHSKPIWPGLTEYLAGTSYCIYVIHHPILMMVNGVANRIGVSSVGPIEIAIVAILVGSYYIDKYFDIPVRKWLLSL